MQINNAEEFQIQKLTVEDPPYINRMQERLTNKKQQHMGVLKCNRQNLYQPLPAGKRAKNITVPFSSACLQSRLKNKAKQTRKQLITKIKYMLKSNRTSCKCEIKHLLKCSLMKPWSWKQGTPQRTCFAFRSSLVSKKGDWQLAQLSKRITTNQVELGQWGTDTCLVKSQT